MNYYDNVKDTVKGDGDSENKASFDTLKEEAEKTDVESDEERGDGTPIEVLEDGGLNEKHPSKSNSSGSNSENSGSTSSDTGSGSHPFNGNNKSGNDVSADLSGLEDRMDKIIDQNEQMIEILRSFAE